MLIYVNNVLTIKTENFLLSFIKTKFKQKKDTRVFGIVSNSVSILSKFCGLYGCAGVLIICL